ncbi:vWA domain-containing protein [Actinocorallia longicatena]|uniref:VWFA domain-containing protein n=1 Tax=Actinocorallia longicatena TaxID=111803 RepID=A0ABP6QHE3_9ACTN
MLDFDGRERAFPFYIVCDVSQSMWDPGFHPGAAQVPLDMLGDAVPELLWQIQTEPAISDATWVGVVGFHSSPQVILRLTRPSEVADLKAFEPGQQTNYASAFTLLSDLIERDCSRLKASYNLKRPVVFFLTDGIPYVGRAEQPEPVWRECRDRLAGLSSRPQIVAFGFGQARGDILCKVATEQDGRPLAFVADGGVSVVTVLTALMDTLFVSITSSVAKGELSLRVPDGMRWASP